MKLNSILVCVMAASFVGGCGNTTQSCNSFVDALRSGAVAGMQEAVTGEQAQNPCLTSQSAPSQGANSDEQNYKQLSTLYGETHAQLIMQGKIAIGMNGDEVVLAWGKPETTKKTAKTKEAWRYGQDKIVFTNGKVSAVTHSP